MDQLEPWGNASPIRRLDRPVRRPASGHGTELHEDGSVTFGLWAPAATSVWLCLAGSDEERLMTRSDGGWHIFHAPDASAGTGYLFQLPDGKRIPDPASRFQPDDVDGYSVVTDPDSYQWGDAAWQGLPWAQAVIYELHIGTFTEAGSFLSAIERLDHIRDLGATCVQLMPVAAFPGQQNWGYDGVFTYAPDASYGTPDELKAFIDAAHGRGLMVMLDVVYNHLGPDGDFIPLYAPQVFTDRYQTPWGDAINFATREVREFVVNNAIYWLEEFHFDGLRLDAVHALKDASDRHILEELAERVAARHRPGRVHLVIENERNEAHRLRRHESGFPVEYAAQWNDDLHHVLHTAITGESETYYASYSGDTEKLGRALAEGFAYQGELMPSSNRPRGEPSAFLPPTSFVAFLQNHDQIGNRAHGDRIGANASPEALRAAAAIYLMLPQIPMIFMGEEWSASSPFPFFSDFAGATGELVRAGRKEEFAESAEFSDARSGGLPDPQSSSTFRSAKLRWDELHDPAHAEILARYRDLLAARKEHIQPLIDRIGGNAGTYQVLAPGCVAVQYRLADGTGSLSLVANLSARAINCTVHRNGHILWPLGTSKVPARLEPWYVEWSFASAPLVTRTPGRLPEVMDVGSQDLRSQLVLPG